MWEMFIINEPQEIPTKVKADLKSMEKSLYIKFIYYVEKNFPFLTHSPYNAFVGYGLI